MRVLPLIAVCLFLSAGFAHAETKNTGSLNGLTEVELIIENLDAEAQDCRITPQLIENAFMFPASSTALKIPKEASTAFYISIMTIHEKSGRCSSLIQFRLYGFQLVKPLFSDLPRFAKVVFWDDYWMGFSNQNEHKKTIRDAVEVVTKKFLTKWNLDNKPQ